MYTLMMGWFGTSLAAASPAFPSHTTHQNVRLRASIASPARRTVRRPEVTVYGYLPYWVDAPLEVDFDSLSHLAWFSVEVNGEGLLSGADEWNSIAPSLVAEAHASGTRVHLCVSLFDAIEQDALLNDATSRTRAVAALAALVREHDADGINVDFEGMHASSREGLVAFTTALKAEVDEVFVALPAIDWRGAYDYDALAHASDGLFIMAYDYHWQNGDPGPVAPLTGGGPWSTYAIDWTVDDYRTWGTPDDKIVVGLPLYGYEWPTESDALATTATGSADAHSMASILNDESLVDLRYDPVTDTPWAWTGSSQLWFDDPDSLAIKLSWSVSQGVQGVGFWALGYADGDPDFWTMVDTISGAAGTPADDAPDSGDAMDSGEATDSGQSPSNPSDEDTGAGSGAPKATGPEALPAACGCSAGASTTMGWWLLGGGLVALRRRQN